MSKSAALPGEQSANSRPSTVARRSKDCPMAAGDAVTADSGQSRFPVVGLHANYGFALALQQLDTASNQQPRDERSRMKEFG
jgi:hypothetical protein